MEQSSLRLLCLVILFAVPTGLTASAAKGPVSVILEAPGKPLKLGAELVLRATLKNDSGHDITFPASPGLVPSDGFRYEIHVLDSRARPAPPSARVRELRKARAKGGPGIAVIGNIGRTLKPGQALPEEINVTRDYDLSSPGIYTIWVTRPLPLGVPVWAAKKYWKGSVRSNTITVTVVK